jgi:phytanoyl-CoA hydroxylase
MPVKTTDNASSPPADLAQRFREDGFFVYENMYTQDEVTQMREHVQNIVDNTDRWPARMFHWGDQDQAAPGSKPTAIQAGHQHDWRFFEWANDERILNVVRPLLGDNVAVYNTSVFMKPPLSPGVIPWHQDQIYYAVATEFLVACWVALTDVTIENGALKYIPASHHHGVLPTQRPTDPAAPAVFDRTIKDVEKLGEVVDVPLTAGSAVFHHSLTAHYSGPNTVNTQRWGLAMDYMKADYSFSGSGEARRAYPIVSGQRVSN